MSESVSPLPPGSRWLTYARDSGHEEQELSVEQQLSEYDRWLAANGQRLAAPHFVDRARSGSRLLGRDGIDSLMALAGQQPRVADGILFWSVARMARNVVEGDYVKAWLRLQGYQIAYIMSRVPAGLGRIGRIIEEAELVEAESYLEKLSEEVRRGQRYLFEMRDPETGLYYGFNVGPVSAGFRSVPTRIGTRRDGRPRIAGRWVVDEAVAPLVLGAFELRARGALLREIHERFPIYRNPQLDSFAELNYMLRNPQYKGTLKRGSLTIENYFPKIVEPGLWDAVQSTWERRRHPRTAGARHLLAGILVCGHCGMTLSTMTVNRAGGREGNHYYRCIGRWKSRDCPGVNFNVRKLDEAITGRVLSHLTPEHLAAAEARAEQERETRGRQQQRAADARAARIDDTKKRIANIMQSLEIAPLSPSLADQLVRRERELAELQAQAGRQSEPEKTTLSGRDLAGLRDELQDALLKRDILRARRALGGLVERVEVFRDRQEIRYRE